MLRTLLIRMVQISAFPARQYTMPTNEQGFAYFVTRRRICSIYHEQVDIFQREVMQGVHSFYGYTHCTT